MPETSLYTAERSPQTDTEKEQRKHGVTTESAGMRGSLSSEEPAEDRGIPSVSRGRIFLPRADRP